MWNPTQSIKSRYATKTISPNFYSTISGSTLIGTKGSGTTSGYIYAPYIVMDSTSLEFRELSIRILREKRKEKLKKLGWS